MSRSWWKFPSVLAAGSHAQLPSACMGGQPPAIASTPGPRATFGLSSYLASLGTSSISELMLLPSYLTYFSFSYTFLASVSTAIQNLFFVCLFVSGLLPLTPIPSPHWRRRRGHQETSFKNFQTYTEVHRSTRTKHMLDFHGKQEKASFSRQEIGTNSTLW